MPWCPWLAALLFATALPVLAVNHEEAESAIRIRDFETAAKIYQSLSEQGDPEAQFALGGFYRSGRGVEKNHKKALYWFLKAAQQEHTEAQYATGAMYEHGWGVKADTTQAMNWYSKAASQGHKLAQKKLDYLANSSPVAGLNDKQTSELLNRAAAAGKTETLKRILATGVSPDTRDDFSRSALHEAVINNRVEAVDLLLAAGANPNTSDSLGDTPLHSAAGRGNAIITRSLIKAGAKLETLDAHKNTP
ncbi:MAG: ankyrin repeat domain-containing protein [Candidatus Thiodiazotropha sp.]